ncbi:MAG: nickel pincer cofactor biosynthesis protein LarC [Armatimonadota bacterium]
MKIAYLDVFCGISGDLMLGALVDAGVEVAQLKAELSKLPVHGWDLQVETVRKSGLAATKVTVVEDHHHHGDHHDHDHEDHHHHHHGKSADEVIAIIRGGTLEADVVERAVAVVERIALAEAKAHGVDRSEVHFHELGGIDTVIDVVGAVVGLKLLGIEKLYCSALPVGRGYVDTAHGRLPVPPPAVANLYEGVATYPLDVEGETVTPTGAGIAVTLAEVGQRPTMRITKVALGAGHKEFPIPNLLRMIIGDTDEAADLPSHEVVLLEANLDDMSGELIGYATEQLFTAGAVDVWCTPIYMKKNRPATMLSALATPENAAAVADAMLLHTSSFGVRTQTLTRQCLDREHVTVETVYGPVRVKVGKRAGQVVTAAPEYADCVAAAEKAQTTLKAMYQAALAKFAEL